MFYPVKKKSDDLKQSLTKPTVHWSVPIHESGILRRGNASLLRLRVGPHNPGAPLHLKALGVGGAAQSSRKASGLPSEFSSVHWGPAGQGARPPAATPKPQQLHKLAVPQPDLFRRQVRPVHVGIRKQPLSLQWLHWQAAPAGGTGPQPP